ncbi:hypothetical protein PCE1_004618 [Barthelona sp. PCE]
MPRFNEHNFTDNGDILTFKHSYLVFKPHNFTPKPAEHNFALIPAFEHALKMPFMYKELELADSDVIFSKKNIVKTNRLKTYVSNGVDSFTEEFSCAVPNTEGLRRVRLMDHHIINFLPRAIKVYNIHSSTVQILLDGQYLRRPKMWRVSVVLVDECYQTPILVGNTFQLVKIPIPKFGFFIEIINSLHPSFYFYSPPKKMYRITVLDGMVDVQELDVKFRFEEENDVPSQAFLVDDLHFFVFMKLGEIKAYRINENGTECLLNMSIFQFRKFIYLNNTLFGMVDDKLIPFTIEYSVDGYCIPLNSFLSKSLSGAPLLFPNFYSSQFVVSFVMFGTQDPSVVIHGSTSEGTKDLFAAKTYAYGDIATQIFRKDKAFWAHEGSYQSDVITLDVNEDIDIDIEYVAGRFVHIDDGILYVDGTEGYVVPNNTWYEIRPSMNVVWVGGSSCIGIMIMKEKHIQFDFYSTDENDYADVVPSKYNPLMTLVFKRQGIEVLTYVNNTFERFHFFNITNFSALDFFIDENIFISSEKMWIFNGEGVEHNQLQLPWKFTENPYYAFTSSERGTITRLHKQLDGYDIVKDILTFDDEYRSFKIRQVRHSLITLLIQSQFHPVSNIDCQIRKEAVLFFEISHNL